MSTNASVSKRCHSQQSHAVFKSVKPDSPDEATILQTARILLEHKANPNTPGVIGQRAMHFATTPRIAAFLLDNKADVDAIDDSCRTALM